ncbi:uncharacterized protein SETTUDRAFT_28082 [Exserohilum turcica Et28A]|uniref:Major facilitator superfamily (MFS) profile domain-containing protein n=1 Tax=Exserohilum turcicum (strain 28A) TaxID=671987 RepID=R0KEN0_EXST2|nr:uncharacterized protein SETTUDRAFT_28082 [Exserohilum turcica Et28A]EOA87784.1 hypothetical protein SETTUDRAFT_28082 [Exserohilum turcica Et28A]
MAAPVSSPMASWSATPASASNEDVEKAAGRTRQQSEATTLYEGSPLDKESERSPERDVAATNTASPSSSQEHLTALDWDGPDDPLNPHNWCTARKWFQTLAIAVFSMMATLSSSVYTPGIVVAAEEFHSTRLLSTLAYSIYTLGLAVGAPLGAPLGETLGRRLIICTSLPIFSLFILGAGFSQNMTTLIVLRFFAGVFASPVLDLGAASLADIWPPEKRSGPMSLYVAMPFCGPGLGPLLGAVVTQTRGWRWTCWLVLFFVVALFFPALPFFKETYKPTLLRRRAKQRNIPLPPMPTDGMSVPRIIHTYATKTLTRPMHMLFTEPIVATFHLYSSFNFALLYSFFAAFPYVFAVEYGFDSISTGLTFLGLGVGIIIATIGIILYNKYRYIPEVMTALAEKRPPPPYATSIVKPERRLPLAVAGAPCITIGLFLFGWSVAYRLHWIVPTIAEAFFGAGNMLIFMSCVMYITDTYGPMYGASAMAGNTILRYILGAVFPLFAVQMFKRLGPQWTSYCVLNVHGVASTCPRYINLVFV